MSPALSRRGRIALFTSVALAGTAVFLLLPPLAQPQGYHHFIDDRTIWGIPNCLNVLSNAPFAIVGLMGFCFLGQQRAPSVAGGFLDGRERLAFAVFFAGAFLTCFGSSYYHWAPDDATLAWDRLPMTLAFMALLAAVIGERIDARAGWRLLWPLVIVGGATVWWWRRTGNLWPYAGAQFFSIVLIGLVLVLFPPRYTRSLDLLWVTGLYVLAKIAEALDRPVFAITGFVSGHTLKHLIAAVAVYWVLRMLQKRSALSLSTPAS